MLFYEVNMNIELLTEIIERHNKWMSGIEGGERADLRYADLENADLEKANLKGANLDFSCLPLWCGSLSAHFDDKQLIQITYHLVKAGLNSKNASDKVKSELSKLVDLANEFHQTDQCGKI